MFFVGILASVYPGSILEGPVNWFIFWLFTVLSIALFITGIVFAITGPPENERKVIEKAIEKAIEGETFNYIVKLCPYCGSANIKSAVVEKADTSEERNTLGFIEKYLFNCDTCKSTWFALKK